MNTISRNRLNYLPEISNSQVHIGRNTHNYSFIFSTSQVHNVQEHISLSDISKSRICIAMKVFQNWNCQLNAMLSADR